MDIKQVAEQVIATLSERYGYYTEQEPTLIEREDSVLVSWECGPYQWAGNDPYWLHEELAPMMAEFGADTSYNPDNYKPYYDEVSGFDFEPEESFSLAIREA
jgi:hypothetical protein